jgi:hypothetical protein
MTTVLFNAEQRLARTISDASWLLEQEPAISI